MNQKQKEEYLDKLFIFMNNELENQGITEKQLFFNFSPSKKMDYFNHPSEIIPDGEDLKNFKKETQILNDDFKTILKLAISRKYIETFGCNNYEVRITEIGRARALSTLLSNNNKKNNKKHNIVLNIANQTNFNGNKNKQKNSGDFSNQKQAINKKSIFSKIFEGIISIIKSKLIS